MRRNAACAARCAGWCLLAVLNNPPPNLAARIEMVGTTGVADGLRQDRGCRPWVTSPHDTAYEQCDGTLKSVIQADRVRWPATLAAHAG